MTNANKTPMPSHGVLLIIEEEHHFWKQEDNAKYISWLRDLLKSDNESTSDMLRNQFEYTAVKNESVTEVTPHLMPIILNLLPSSGSIAKANMFDLLYAFGAGYSDFDEGVYYADEVLEPLCRQQVKYGISQYFYYLEQGSPAEKLALVDLLELCSRDEPIVRARVAWTLNQFIG